MQPQQRPAQQRCLRARVEVAEVGTVAVAISRTVEHDHPVGLGKPVDDTAEFEIPDHAAIAVNQHDDRSGAAVDVMQPHAVDIDEFALRRIVAFSLAGAQLGIEGRSRQHRASGEEGAADLPDGVFVF
jgi:hypothetical protein